MLRGRVLGDYPAYRARQYGDSAWSMLSERVGLDFTPQYVRILVNSRKLGRDGLCYSGNIEQFKEEYKANPSYHPGGDRLRNGGGVPSGLLTYSQAATVLSYSRSHIYDFDKKGDLERVTCSGLFYISQASVNTFLANYTWMYGSGEAVYG